MRRSEVSRITFSRLQSHKNALCDARRSAAAGSVWYFSAGAVHSCLSRVVQLVITVMGTGPESPVVPLMMKR
jgi:hypothetical protein